MHPTTIKLEQMEDGRLVKKVYTEEIAGKCNRYTSLVVMVVGHVASDLLHASSSIWNFLSGDKVVHCLVQVWNTICGTDSDDSSVWNVPYWTLWCFGGTLKVCLGCIYLDVLQDLCLLPWWSVTILKFEMVASSHDGLSHSWSLKLRTAWLPCQGREHSPVPYHTVRLWFYLNCFKLALRTYPNIM